MSRKKAIIAVGTISKLDLLKAPIGHQLAVCGTGYHKNAAAKRNGRGPANRKAIAEYETSRS